MVAVVMVVCGFGIGALAQSVPEPVHQRTAQFFKLLAAGEVERAYGQLLRGSSPEDSLRAAQLWERTQQLHERCGLPVGYEIVRSATLGRSLVQLTCVGLYGHCVAGWELLFYRSPRRGWIVLRVKLREQPEELFPGNNGRE